MMTDAHYGDGHGDADGGSDIDVMGKWQGTVCWVGSTYPRNMHPSCEKIGKKIYIFG